MGWVLAVFAVIAVAGIWMWAAENRSKKTLEAHVLALEEFAAQHLFVGADGLSALAIDDGRKLLCFAVSIGHAVSHRLIPYSAVMSADVEEDGTVVSSASRGSQLAGAAVGGVLLGGVGAVVGAMTGSRKETRTVQRVVLKIGIEDVVSPLLSVTFQSLPGPSDGVIHKVAIQQCKEWQARLEAVMRQSSRQAGG
ncbi:hypothetical protein [Stenotrophomonas maltophilia]|uniref:hypothetical protein n=1 Tax=Stenotrophomonas maltophilia TaxID=40324 RepID=UPI0007EFF0D1|nr:hypothetical protein [Stenotrophomonas maltophilia]OBU50141.1 hypothetical protein A9K76_07970 [Stenotrophomonas maltophilia]